MVTAAKRLKRLTEARWWCAEAGPASIRCAAKSTRVWIKDCYQANNIGLIVND